LLLACLEHSGNSHTNILASSAGAPSPPFLRIQNCWSAAQRHRLWRPMVFENGAADSGALALRGASSNRPMIRILLGSQVARFG